MESKNKTQILIEALTCEEVDQKLFEIFLKEVIEIYQEEGLLTPAH